MFTTAAVSPRPSGEQAASAAAETRPYTPSGTESAAEKPSPAAGNTAD